MSIKKWSGRWLFALAMALCAWCASFGTSARAAETVLNTTQDSFYPRLIRLAASGAANGRLMASHDLGGSQSLIYESTNQGATWAQVGSITVPETWHCCSTLWEVPQALGSTAAGTLFWATTGRNGTSAYALRVYRSTDVGRTWTQLSVPATGTTGIWEPEFIVGSAGRLLMFYSSEEYKAGGYNQLLAHKVSTNGGVSWGADVIDVGVSDGGDLRPGMAVVRKLPNNSYVMTYEICGSRACDVYVRTSANGSSWGTASDMGTRVESTAGNHFGHTPTITWLDDGSVQGRLLLIGQLLKRNAGGTVVDDANGRTYMFNTAGGAGAWTEAATPLATPAGSGGDACTNYSTQLLASADNTRLLQLAGMSCRMQFASAPLNNPVADGVYRLVAKHSNQVLDVNACAMTPGANVQQYSWIGGDCQRWRLANTANGAYTITAQHSGQALGVNGCSTAAGGNVQQDTATGAACQQWRIEPVGDGYYRLVNQNSNLVLDVNACSTVLGANVQQWGWVGGDCQRWRFERVSPNAVAAGNYRVMAKHSGQAMEVAACATAAGGNVQQGPYSGPNCQRWAVAQTADGFYEFTSINSGLKLDVENASLRMGANVRQWTGNNAAAQRWGVENVGAGFVRIVNKNSGRVLDVAACSTANGANVAQWEWLGGDCQRWQLLAP